MQLVRKTLEHLMSGYRQSKDQISRVTAPAKRVIEPVMTPVHNSPDNLVKGVINLANYLGNEYTKSRLKGIKKRDISQQSMNYLFEQLLQYVSAQEIENNPEFWRQLSTNLSELKGYAHYLRFDTVMRQFLKTENYTPTEIGTLIEKVNEHLSYARDISIIIDPDHLRTALKDRTDFMGKKLAPSLLRNNDLESNIRQALTNGDVYVVAHRNVNIVGDSEYSRRLQPFFRNFVNPTLERLVEQEENALEEYEEVANSTQIGIATARGNLRGVKNVIVYVGSAYALANTAILLARNSGIDVSPTVTNTINSVAITLAMYIPSANEVMEIAGEIKAEKFYRLIKSYEVGHEKGDLTLYRKTLAYFSPEEIFKPFQGIGWEGASVLSAVSVSTGLTETPWVFALINSLQVSMNNWFGNIVMCYNNHFKPLVMERRRELLAQHPELINYFGLEAIVDPKASDQAQDLNRLNPRIVEYLPQFNRDVDGQTTSREIVLRRQNVEEVTESEVMNFMGKFNNLTDAQKRYQLMWLANKYSFMLLKDSFSRQFRNGSSNINEVNGDLQEVTRPDRHYYIGLGKDIFKSIGLPLPTPGYSELRFPKGSFFNRSFPYMNVYVPAMWFLAFERIASLGYSPVDIINKTNIDSLESILYAIGAAIIAQGVLTAGGAADTALAGWGAAKEIIYESGRRAKKYLSKVQLQLGLNSLEGKNDSLMYEIPVDTSYHSHHEQLEDLLIPLSEKNRLRTSRVLGDSDDSFVVQKAYGKFFNPIYITAIREQGQDSFRIFTNRELGENLARYRLNQAN